MSYSNKRIADVAALLTKRFEKLADKAEILKAVELKALYAEIPSLALKDRGGFGKEINQLRAELEKLVSEHTEAKNELPPIDVTAPFDLNVPADRRPHLLPAEHGSQHPLMAEINNVLD